MSAPSQRAVRADLNWELGGLGFSPSSGTTAPSTCMTSGKSWNPWGLIIPSVQQRTLLANGRILIALVVQGG